MYDLFKYFKLVLHKCPTVPMDLRYTIHQLPVFSSLSYFVKNSVSDVWKSLFSDIRYNQYQPYTTIYTDGSSQGDSVCGAVWCAD